MISKELRIQSIKPLAILKGGLSGTRFIAEAIIGNDQTKLLSFIPPDYNLEEAIPIEEYILESAVIKHEYQEVEHDPIETIKNYEQYLQEINQIEK